MEMQGWAKQDLWKESWRGERGRPQEEYDLYWENYDVTFLVQSWSARTFLPYRVPLYPAVLDHVQHIRALYYRNWVGYVAISKI